MPMSRKHYQLVANVINTRVTDLPHYSDAEFFTAAEVQEAYMQGVMSVARDLSTQFRIDNSAFDPERFFTACIPSNTK